MCQTLLMELRPVIRTSVSDAVFEQLSRQIVAGSPGDRRTVTRRTPSDRGAGRQPPGRPRSAQAPGSGGAGRGAPRRLDPGARFSPRRRPRPVAEPARRPCRQGRPWRRPLDHGDAGEHRSRPGPIVRQQGHTRPGRAHRGHRRRNRRERRRRPRARLGVLDLDFWDAMVEGADNIAYRLSLNSLRRVVEAAGAPLRAVLAAELLDRDGHQAIADAVRAGDADATETAARALLAVGTAAVNSVLAGLGPDTAADLADQARPARPGRSVMSGQAARPPIGGSTHAPAQTSSRSEVWSLGHAARTPAGRSVRHG